MPLLALLIAVLRFDPADNQPLCGQNGPRDAKRAEPAPGATADRDTEQNRAARIKYHVVSLDGCTRPSKYLDFFQWASNIH